MNKATGYSSQAIEVIIEEAVKEFAASGDFKIYLKGCFDGFPELALRTAFVKGMNKGQELFVKGLLKRSEQ